MALILGFQAPQTQKHHLSWLETKQTKISDDIGDWDFHVK